MHGSEHVPWASEFEDLRDEGTAAYYGPLYRLSSPQPVALCRDEGECIDYPVADIPDHAGAVDLLRDNCRPISVKIQNGGEHCSVIVLTPSGTRCASVTPGTALALYQSGVHAVVEGGLRAEVPCSKHNGCEQKGGVPDLVHEVLENPMAGQQQRIRPADLKVHLNDPRAEAVVAITHPGEQSRVMQELDVAVSSPLRSAKPQ